MSQTILHGYWRSSAAYRVRIALNVKGIAYEQVAHDLRAGEQRDPAYLAIAPHGLVPALEHDGAVLIESPAILEWIEAKWPEPPLLPASPADAATVRAIAALVGCDIHPLNNLRVLTRLRSQFDADNAQVKAWIAHWIGEGFGALEQLIARTGGRYAFGDTPTFADCYLVPQVYNAERYNVDLAAFPRTLAAAEAARALPAFAAAHPDLQPDFQ
ncbi:maleylacetoacetate isomerase [Sphingopyxis macrogoltabida]|uniref:Maleylacetoacetate isomerase n=1 Tax=Sphingopyxis macrogoltabida TaxID=33050 RepID=A0A0N9V086_SPHMC|nr:maleylacetoacetate isomerase [Sphingopyxis macrogoltabida]ALH80929.1 maleylacetoacetate isomerase [Sphingopyxis macrogoltabida]